MYKTRIRTRQIMDEKNRILSSNFDISFNGYGNGWMKNLYYDIFERLKRWKYLFK